MQKKIPKVKAKEDKLNYFTSKIENFVARKGKKR